MVHKQIFTLHYTKREIQNFPLDQLIADTAYTYEDLGNLMDDRDRWKELINESRASSS